MIAVLLVMFLHFQAISRWNSKYAEYFVIKFAKKKKKNQD